MQSLTVAETAELEQHERIIERGLTIFVEVGLALAAIREKRLYKQRYRTFEQYCQERWNITPQHGRRLIEAATIVDSNIEPIGFILPSSESQVRPLTKLEPAQQRQAWKEAVEAAQGKVPTAAHVSKVVRSILRAERGQDKPPPFPAGKFGVIYADPPWAYDNSGFEQSAASHYPTMPTQEICDLPIPELCTPDTVLFLWATSPLLDQAFEVIRAWGFTYKASMIWDKGKGPTIGWFVQTEHELLLIATRESNRHPQIKPKSVVHITPSRHSAKPPEFYEIIENMYAGPYCELFARNGRYGWHSWGQEVGREQSISCLGNQDATIWQQAMGLGRGLEQSQMGAVIP